MEFLISVIMSFFRKSEAEKHEDNRHAKRNWKRRSHVLSFSKIMLALVLAFLFIPLFVIIIYSFNSSKGADFEGFSLVWYEKLFLESIWSTPRTTA